MWVRWERAGEWGWDSLAGGQSSGVGLESDQWGGRQSPVVRGAAAGERKGLYLTRLLTPHPSFDPCWFATSLSVRPIRDKILIIRDKMMREIRSLSYHLIYLSASGQPGEG